MSQYTFGNKHTIFFQCFYPHVLIGGSNFLHVEIFFYRKRCRQFFPTERMIIFGVFRIDMQNGHFQPNEFLFLFYFSYTIVGLDIGWVIPESKVVTRIWVQIFTHSKYFIRIQVKKLEGVWVRLAYYDIRSDEYPIRRMFCKKNQKL